MEFLTDMVGHALGTFTPGDVSDTLRDAHGALAGQVLHGLAGGPDIVQGPLGQTTGYVYHGFGGHDTVTNAFGQTQMSFDHGVGGSPDLIHDAAGSLLGAVQHGPLPGMPATLLDANWSSVAQSFNVQGLQGF